jgi:hypothetical protein
MEILTEKADVDRCERTLEQHFKRGAAPFMRTVQAANLSFRCKVHWDAANGVWAHFRPNETLFWNAFGLDDPEESGHSKYVRNIVQINPSRVGHFNTGGAFVHDPEADAVYIAHSGKLGGESVGLTESFIATFDTVLLTAGKQEKPYTIIADIEDPRLNERIAAFVAAAAAFKSQTGSKAKTSKKSKPLDGEEYAGKIRYRRGGYVATVRRHGRVYASLKRALNKLGIDGLQRDVNRDLFFKGDDRYVLFEIKTDASPYSVYTAVGQLMLHGDGVTSRVSRIFVAPEQPTQFADGLKSLGISTITYRDDGKKIVFDGLDVARKACR